VQVVPSILLRTRVLPKQTPLLCHILPTVPPFLQEVHVQLNPKDFVDHELVCKVLNELGPWAQLATKYTLKKFQVDVFRFTKQCAVEDLSAV
jgi:hypothetical protein